MTTILVRNGKSCETCGNASIDDKKTGEKARAWRRAVNVPQYSIANNGMGIRQSYYSALELGQRHWTPALVSKFEAAILPLIEERKLDVEKL